MTSWIYLFSKFTPEALLFEALVILLLGCGYSAFWILRKRRIGAVENTVPVGVVKDYLNELILDAQDLRVQLFGLLGIPPEGASHSPARTSQRLSPLAAEAAASAASAHALAASASSNDPAFAEKMSQLESKLAEQEKSMNTLIIEKTRIEKELQSAKAGGATAAAGGNAGSNRELEEKIKLLESKLSEYSVIEDDLANLKRLQQENAQLKAALAGKGEATASAPAETAAMEAAPVAETPAPVIEAATPAAEPAEAAAPVEAIAEPEVAAPVAEAAAVEEKATDAATPATEAPNAEAVAAAPAAAEAAFEGLVDQVEQSLQPPAGASAHPTTPAAETSTPEPPGATLGKSDADLLAEFEKMLNS